MDNELQEVEKILKEGTEKKSVEKGRYYTKKEPRKTISTFLRNQNKFAVSAAAIADRKAMIMIRINSTIVSALIVFYKQLHENVENAGLIIGILMVGSAGALICSVLAARPNGSRLKRIFEKYVQPKYPNLSSTIFMTFTFPTIEEYEDGMNEVVKSQELQVGNQVRFHYILEKYLGQKYLLLDIAYNLFLLSFVAVALIFLFTKFVL